MRRIGLLAVIAAVIVSGCGGGGSSSSSAVVSNQEKIEANATSEAKNPSLEVELMKTLTVGLGAFDEKDVGVENVYKVSRGICDVTGIATARREIEALEGSPNGLVSPEGNAVVSVNYMIDPNSNEQATLAECQEAALKTLGWSETSEAEAPESSEDSEPELANVPEVDAQLAHNIEDAESQKVTRVTCPEPMTKEPGQELECEVKFLGKTARASSDRN
jgi:hypothetical protein